jgi:hypothetical protein
VKNRPPREVSHFAGTIMQKEKGNIPDRSLPPANASGPGGRSIFFALRDVAKQQSGQKPARY